MRSFQVIKIPFLFFWFFFVRRLFFNKLFCVFFFFINKLFCVFFIFNINFLKKKKGIPRLKNITTVLRCRSYDLIFAYKSHLLEHKDSLCHSDPKYRCTSCPKLFTRRSNLTRHMRIRSGVKPYICVNCATGFIDHTSWKCHESTCAPRPSTARIKNPPPHLNAFSFFFCMSKKKKKTSNINIIMSYM